MSQLDAERRPPFYIPADDSRDRLIRVEENLKHINSTLQEIRTSLEHQNTLHTKDYKDTNVRLDAVEKRVDRIYWLWGAVVFIGSPIMVVVTKLVMHQFGL